MDVEPSRVTTYIREGGAKMTMIEVASVLSFRCESISVVISGLGGPLHSVRRAVTGAGDVQGNADLGNAWNAVIPGLVNLINSVPVFR